MVIVIVILVAVGIFTSKKTSAEKVAIDQFAQCLADSGTKFYGTYWCPHCQNQKKLFKNSKNLPYIECANPDGSEVEVCKNENITGYPTWKFADGSELQGELSFETLASKTACPLPY